MTSDSIPWTHHPVQINRSLHPYSTPTIVKLSTEHLRSRISPFPTPPCIPTFHTAPFLHQMTLVYLWSAFFSYCPLTLLGFQVLTAKLINCQHLSEHSPLWETSTWASLMSLWIRPLLTTARCSDCRVALSHWLPSPPVILERTNLSPDF